MSSTLNPWITVGSKPSIITVRINGVILSYSLSVQWIELALTFTFLIVLHSLLLHLNKGYYLIFYIWYY